MGHSIPLIDIGPLFGMRSLERDLTDQAIMTAAATSGFMVVRGLPSDVPAGRAARADLLRLFQLPEHETRKLWRQKFDPAHPNVYRGWFPLQTGFLTAKEGIDMGPDVVHGAAVVCGGDPLREATPLPSAEALPGWRESVSAYYRAMEKVSQALMRAIARGLSLEERFFDQAFDRGLSTLRLLRYPVRTDTELTARSDPSVWVTHDGLRCTSMAHRMSIRDS
jgi:isopenicillin N synthase-like dioxygenase